jgi:hypothetical protein
VAWVPLAPGEIYYGRGNYGRSSVNITNVNITQVNITNVYKNVNVNNGVTVVTRKTFNTGTPTAVNVNKNIIQEKIFVKNNFSVGTPDIKPTKASYFVSTRQIQLAKLPPEPIRNLQVKELKHSRPLIKEQDKSVLNPGVKPKALPVNTVTTPRTPGKGRPMIQQVKPEEKKPVAPEGGRGAIEERKRVKPEEREVKPEEKGKPAGPEGGPTGRGEKQRVKPEEKKPVAPEGGREKKDKKKPAELDESPQEDKKRQGEEEPER